MSAASNIQTRKKMKKTGFLSIVLASGLYLAAYHWTDHLTCDHIHISNSTQSSLRATSVHSLTVHCRLRYVRLSSIFYVRECRPSSEVRMRRHGIQEQTNAVTREMWRVLRLGSLVPSKYLLTYQQLVTVLVEQLARWPGLAWLPLTLARSQSTCA